MSNYKMFLDDERNPVETGLISPVIVRSYDSAVAYMTCNGCPRYISFDHDLGENKKTGYDLVKWMIEQDLNSDGDFIPRNFQFYVHSMNPVGKENIEKLLNNFLSVRRK